MPDMDRLFELIDEAMRAMKCKCVTTTKAYLNLVRLEGYHLARIERDPVLARCLQAAAAFIGGLASKLMWNEKTFAAVRHTNDFWMGFDDGLNDRTMGRREGAAYRRGYQYGKDGR
jgi:hypothetical protein